MAKAKKTSTAPPKPSLIRRLFKWALIMGLVLTLAGVGTLVGGYLYFSQDLPNIDSLDDYKPPQVTRVYAADGETVIGELFTERRTVVRRDQIPKVMVSAMLAAEDADFYNHEGLDYMGMGRALWKAITSGRIKGGGSTITQQTVKTFLLSPEKTFSRKAKEIILARRIEDKLTKDEILSLYLNQIYFGHGRYGVQEAARYYFGKDIEDVAIEEAALLAGLVQSPNRLSPRRAMDKATARRAYVLKQMAEKGFAKPEVVEAALKRPIELAPIAEVHPPEVGWFLDEVRKQLIAELGHEAVHTSGLKVETTLDLPRQRAAMRAVLGGLKKVDGRQKYIKKIKTLPGPARQRWLAKRAKALKGQPPAVAVPVPALVSALEEGDLIVKLGVGEARVKADFLARYRDEEGALPFAPGDVVEVVIRGDGPKHPEQMHGALKLGPQGALVALDPVTREVKAMVGGDDHRAQPFNRALQARRQPGSAFKPFVWGAAYETGRFTPATVMMDAPETWPMGGEKWWKPKNYTQKYRGPMRLKVALAKSVNSIAVKLLYDVGVPNVKRFAQNAGLTSELTNNLTLALGSSEVTPMELANAYATIAAGGRHGEPRFITAITDAQGRAVNNALTAQWQSKEVLSPEVTWLLRHTMRAVVQAGSAFKAFKGYDRPVAGKTGTTNEARDLWFVGLLPDVVTVGWVGFDDRTPVGRKETGGKSAAPIVRAYLQAAESSEDAPGWPEPPEGVEMVTIDKESGLRAPEGAKGYEEYFISGTAPREVATPKGSIDAGNFFMEEATAGGFGWDMSPIAPIKGKPTTPKAVDPQAGGRLAAPAFDPEDLPR